MIQNLSRNARYGVIGDSMWGNLAQFFKNLGAAATPMFSITVRDFYGNTTIQTVAGQPALYIVGPPQYTVLGLASTISTVILPGNHQGLYIREREPSRTPDGNVWFRWEEDQPVIGLSPTAYANGVF